MNARQSHPKGDQLAVRASQSAADETERNQSLVSHATTPKLIARIMPTPILHPFRLMPAVLLLGALLFAPPPAAAHIEENMPDGVAQMEYAILLEFEPDNTVVRNKLGMVYYRQGKLPLATAEFERVLARKPADPDALDALGLVHAQEQRHDQAISLFEKAIAANPTDVMVRYHLGQSLEKTGKLPEALAAYETALANSKNEPETERLRVNVATITDTLIALRTKMTELSLSTKRN